MQVIQLTPPQQAEVAALQATLKAAEAPFQAANKALRDTLNTIAGVPAGRFARIQVSADGTALVVQ
jgi:hypothetical protein